MLRFMTFLATSLIVLMFSVSAQAMMIQVGNHSVSALTLDQDFHEFYAYHQDRKWSSDTGLEQRDMLIGMFAKRQDQLALYVFADKPGFGGGGHASIEVVENAGSSEVLFKNDNGDIYRDTDDGFTIDWMWYKGKNDGMIMLIDNPSLFDLDITFSNMWGIDGISFWSFAKGSMASRELINGFSDNLKITAIPAPPASAFLFVGIFWLFQKRRLVVRKDFTRTA